MDTTMEITSVPLLGDWQWRMCCLDADEESIIWAEANETTETNQ